MAGVRKVPETLKVLAPAKLNLTLEVLGKRADGFHEIRSVIQTIGLCDELSFRLSADPKFSSDMAGWVVEKSLVSRAASLLREAMGCGRGAVVEVRKRVPLMSGLGGDSSDAAAALRGLNELWGVGLPHEQLLRLAEKLGSDVPFFLSGGTALAEGRGERITPLPPAPRLWILLAVPDVPRRPGKTGALYASLNPSHYTDGSITGKFIEALRAGIDLTPYLFNVFESVAFSRFPGLGELRERFIRAGAGDVHLAGSGPALFAITPDRSRAEELSIRLTEQGLEPCLTSTVESAQDCCPCRET